MPDLFKYPTRRIYVMAGERTIEQRLERYELETAVDLGLSRERAEALVQKTIVHHVEENGGDTPLKIELTWREKEIRMLTADGELDVQMLLAVAYYFTRVEF